MAEHRTQPDPDETGMPGGIPYIVGNEAAERFSFYGMKAILAVFLTKHLLGTDGTPDFMSDEAAKASLAWFTAAAYFTPFAGAIIADRWWGKYHTILYLSLFYCLGHGTLALIDTPAATAVAPRWIMLAGLVLIALGSGGIKPCVTAHVGDQFGPSNKHLLTRVYGWFYFSINFGAFFSQLLTPYLLNEPRFGPAWAFGVPGVLMGLATLMFWLGRHQFVHVPPAGPSFWEETFSPEGLRALANLTPLLLFVAMFWSLFDQTASAWVLQAEELNRVLPLIGWRLTPSQVQAINPIMVLLLVPFFSLVVYPLVGRVIEVTPLRKIGVGLFVASASFAVSAFIEQQIQNDAVQLPIALAESAATLFRCDAFVNPSGLAPISATVSDATSSLIEQSVRDAVSPGVLWQGLAYFVLTCAEVMVSITMLEFFYTQSPRKMKSIVMAFCMLSISLGNIFTALVNTFIETEDGKSLLPGASYYWFFAGAALVVAVLYCVWAPFYRGQTYLQGEEGS